MAGNKSNTKGTAKKSTKSTTQNRKKSSTGTTNTKQKKNTTRRRTAANRKNAAADSNAGMYGEITLWLTLALSIIVLISNFGVGGIVGNAISDFFFGIMGLVCYIFPLFLFLIVAFMISNRRNVVAYRKTIGCILLFFSSCALMQLITEGYTKGTGILEYFEISSTYKTGGGIIGGIICNVSSVSFGTIGAYVLTIVFIIISLILITKKSFFAILKKGSTKVYHNARTNHQKIKENRQKQKEFKTMLVGPERPVQKQEQKPEPKQEPEIIKKDDDIFIQREDSLDELFPPEPDMKTLAEITVPAEKMPESMEEILPEKEEKQTKKKASTANARSSKQEIEDGIHNIKDEIAHQEKEKKEAVNKKEYHFPPIELLKKGKQGGGDSNQHLRETARKLQETLHNFGVNVTVTNVSCGPTVTRYELSPEQGVKVSRIVGLTDDIKLNLAATDIRIEAPIPGKAAVGIEVPNASNSTVMLRDLLQSEAFKKSESKLSFAAGKDIAGQPVITDIAKMPHLLVAGATGSGKSVCINTLIMSILYKATPDEVKLIMIDPKVVELSVYNGIPHLYIPVVTDPKKAAGALNWAVAEMTERYNKFAEYNVRDLKGYNKKVESIEDIEDENKPQKMPQIVIIVDELADLMMVAPGEVEDAICRLAQLARAAGIHLIIATQRPSVNVITGLIKANMPSRIAFSVSSGVDSRTIIDMNGAEKLLGKGDMLFYPQGYQKPARVQGAFVSDQEVGEVVKFLSDQNTENIYNEEIQHHMDAVRETAQSTSAAGGSDHDAYFTEAGKFIIEKDKASIGMLQRAFKIGFNRAARIMDQLCDAGVVGSEEGTKPRKVLMTMEEFEKYIEESL